MLISELDHAHTISLERASSKDLFQVELDWDVHKFSEKRTLVPDIDPHYAFDVSATKAILLGFTYNQRVLVQGLHGSGKSTHIEQIAARLNWPCLRVNLDGHITRSDLLGKDVIKLQDGKPVSLFQEGILPWAIQRPIALVLDEYDAARPEVLFVLQQVLEQGGSLTLFEENRRITPHPQFRLFATANTVGLGDSTGLYLGTHPLNQGQLDRWTVVAKLSYMEMAREHALIMAKAPGLAEDIAQGMVAFADLTREGFRAGDLALPMSPRTVLGWAHQTLILKDPKEALSLSFLNRFEADEVSLLHEYYQRAFGD